MVTKLNPKQIQLGKTYPKEVAMVLSKETSGGNIGFKGVTINVAYQLSTGIYDIYKAKEVLQLRLETDFKTTNPQKLDYWMKVLDDFYDFITVHGLVFEKSYFQIDVPIADSRKINGRSCPLFKDKSGKHCGVIILDNDFNADLDFIIPIQIHVLSNKLNLKSYTDLDIYVFKIGSRNNGKANKYDFNFEDIKIEINNIFNIIQNEYEKIIN